ncbi:signal transduction histidine-protein kinase BaeS [Clostridium tepidiprofundi DSM 19306]|uniref:histidine kinase n=1 Tax=Clostridium tepidiprofundi DSM 19306 TaxID=1121338 RepID=A0A151B450_9CLOT|nr:HAMP domain-containing sensor histidine kinase [Clostridium tepidiprofundi]KYH34704.1 signal transduction histidine-protein kinase BaeS [Clostridium tepidiprofundi DSM 19306]
MKSIKSRIYIQNGIIIIMIVLIFECVFILGLRNYYYGSVKQKLLNKAYVCGSLYNSYLSDVGIYEKATYILENESKDRYVYMQVFDKNKNLVIDSNGLKYHEYSESSNDRYKNNEYKYNKYMDKYDEYKDNEYKDNGYKGNEYQDIEYAITGKRRVVKGYFNDESIMSISIPLYQRDNIVGVLRYIISTQKMGKYVLKIELFALSIGIFVIIVSFLLSSILAKRIINPVKELTSTAISMAKGDFSKRVCNTSEDEIGRLSDTLNYMANEIVKSNAVKNEFISSISHELRTPLTAIKGWSEIILSGDVENFDDAKQGIQIISDEASRLIELVEELLDFSRFESGRISLTFENIDINSLIRNVCNYFKNRIDKKNIKLVINSYSENCVVKCDKNRLKQVFINIIDNAVKFSNIGGNIEVNIYKKDKYDEHEEKQIVFVEIVDNGIGISKDDICKVTQKFYKGKSNRSGNGIGLAICREIISMHGGELIIESEENKGTRVIVKILTNL